MPKPSSTRPKIAVLGGAGFLGSELVRRFASWADPVSIDRENYAERKGERFDLVVNANGNSRRFWANAHPAEDFEASVISVASSFDDFPSERYVYISSSDVYPEHGDPVRAGEAEPIAPERLSAYGLHKWLAEQLVRQRFPNSHIILRPSAMLGPGLKKGPVYDILQGNPLFITPDSELQFIATSAVAEIIRLLVAGDRWGGIWNVGGEGAVRFDKLAEFFAERDIGTSPEAERQKYEMNVSKISAEYPLKTSTEYLKEYINEKIYQEAD